MFTSSFEQCLSCKYVHIEIVRNEYAEYNQIIC